MPSTSSAMFAAHLTDLWEAIVADDPARAMPLFFPKAAYLQVKAIKDPAGDYQTRLIAAYEQDIHTLHASLGEDPSQAQIVRIIVPETAQWINPGAEYNKESYWRVLDSKIVYRQAGREKTMMIKSMISWRGEWYVVHLTSIR